MSRKERARLTILGSVKRKELTLVQAGGLMGVCYRQAKRVWRRYQTDGDRGLVHRLRGKPSARRKPAELRAQVLARYAEERYADFGPTLLAEHLGREGWVVDHNTVRRWLIAEGKWEVRRRRQRHRQWRERKQCFGAMVQLDGSHHDWFEGRRGKCVLMVMVDDATNRMKARFVEQETTRASYDVMEGWIRQNGVPLSVYVDRDSIYRCEAEPSLAEQLAAKEPKTQFGRAMEQLGVELILANSPQAKGRVERINGVLQDRLVKELRLAGISDLDEANRFLERSYLRAFNRQFERPPASAKDLHRPVPTNLNEAFSWEQEQVVQRDWTVACGGRWYQLDRRHEPMSLVGRRVIVRTLRDGRCQLVYRGTKLKYRELSQRPSSQQRPPRRVGRVKLWRPAAEHPWRHWGGAVGKRFWRKTRMEGRPPTGPQTLRRGPRPQVRSAPVRGGVTPIGDRPSKHSPHEKGDILS